MAFILYVVILCDKMLKKAEISIRPQAPNAWILFFADCLRVLGCLVGRMRQVVTSRRDFFSYFVLKF